MTRHRRERPLKRVNPSGKTVWVARYTRTDGKRQRAPRMASRYLLT